MIQTSVADQIIQVINDLCQKFGIVMDWSVENLVPIAEHLGGRIIDWKIASSWFLIILCGILFIVGIVCIICAFKYDIDYGIGFALLLVGILASVFFGVALCVNIFELIKCISFPELAILEYIQTFMQ